jgi:uncharacterized membrane protein
MASANSINVNEQERLLSMFGAGLFTACGLLRGSTTFLALGAGLAYRGYTGHCHVYEALGHNTADQRQSQHSGSDNSEKHESRVILSDG